MPNWDHVSSVIKRMAYGSAIPATLRHTINLRLSDQVVLDALKSKKGFAGYMQDRIARCLRHEFGPRHPIPDFVIGLEGAHGLDPFHIHGAIAMEPGRIYFDRQQPVGPDGERIRAALLKAGGEWPGRARQLLLEECYDVTGWFSYIGKYRLVTARALLTARKRLGISALGQEESLVGATLALRRAGKRWYTAALASEEYVLRDERRR